MSATGAAKTGKRCVCGRSRTFPVCDGSHVAERWRCRADGRAEVPSCFVTARSLENLAERLASEHGGVALHDATDPVSARRVVVISDGTDLEGLLERAETVRATERVAIALDLDAGLLGGAFPGWTVLSVHSDDLSLYAAVTGALSDLGRARSSAIEVERAFVSHAVADEGELAPALAYLRRHFGADLFVCGDSLRAGSEWHREITAELEARPVFLLVVSRASRASTFCAYEAGYAVARQKRLALVSLDGQPPPAHVQHLHVVDVERRLAARPWLDRTAALVESLLAALAPR